MLRELIAFDTTSSKPNRPAADYLDTYLVKHGCTTARFESDSGRKVNLLVRKGPDVDGGLMLCGHLDVVPADEPEWSSNPFDLVESGDRLVARGAADMKGFVALASQMLADADADALRVPLYGLFTHDEEIGTVGAARFAEQWDGRWRLPSACIVGEPTELRVVRMHKGHLRLRVSVRGVAAHSGYPQLGSNAIVKLGTVINALYDLSQELEAERCATSAHFPETPYVVLNQGQVAGGVAVNIVPDLCTLEVGVRILPGQQSFEYIDRVREAVRGLPDVGDDVSVDVVSDSPPLHTAEDAEVNQRLCRQIGQKETVAVSYASDAGPLAVMGVECVLFGPGSISVAHRPNEFLPRTQLEAAGETLAELVNAWCAG